MITSFSFFYARKTHNNWEIKAGGKLKVFEEKFLFSYGLRCSLKERIRLRSTLQSLINEKFIYKLVVTV